MNLLGLDYGTKTVGVAGSDSLGITACGIETIFRDKSNKLRKTLSRISEICMEREIDLIVLGFPKNMDDSIGERASDTLKFKEALEKRTDLEVVLWDERCTTIEANEILKEKNIGINERKKYIDKIAACIILQDYMDNN